jgi:hypothetical protein
MGCTWERKRSVTGTFFDRIASGFYTFSGGQVIVDILPTDIAFRTTDPCGPWSTTPRRGLEANVSPGVWLVGSQVVPGTYRTLATTLCIWYRLRDFSGEDTGTIATCNVRRTGRPGPGW